MEKEQVLPLPTPSEPVSKSDQIGRPTIGGSGGIRTHTSEETGVFWYTVSIRFYGVSGRHRVTGWQAAKCRRPRLARRPRQQHTMKNEPSQDKKMGPSLGVLGLISFST